MTDQERITKLEARIAQIEARVADLERFRQFSNPTQTGISPPTLPLWPAPPWTVTCDTDAAGRMK